MAFPWLEAIMTGAQTGLNLFGQQTAANAQKTAARQNLKMQRETNAMTMELANTAHQREIADLKAAGLNPLLSGTGGAGSSTPTLTAPKTNSAAGETMGNAMSQMMAQAIQFVSGQQQIQQLQAQTQNTEAETELKKVETLTRSEQLPYVSKTAELNLNEGYQRINESTQRTLESEARTATENVLREPRVRQVMADVAYKSQQTKTEEQRTIESREAAYNAKKLYGAKAEEAAIVAAQMATYYKQFFAKEHQQQIDGKDLQNEILTNEKTLKIIEVILKKDYGRAEALSKIDWMRLIGPAVTSNSNLSNKWGVKP